MRFQKVIIRDLEIAVFDYAFKLPNNGRKVFTLPYVVRLEARRLKVVDQLLRSVTVVADF